MKKGRRKNVYVGCWEGEEKKEKRERHDDLKLPVKCFGLSSVLSLSLSLLLLSRLVTISKI